MGKRIARNLDNYPNLKVGDLTDPSVYSATGQVIGKVVAIVRKRGGHQAIIELNDGVELGAGTAVTVHYPDGHAVHYT